MVKTDHKGIVAIVIKFGHWKQGRAFADGVDSPQVAKPLEQIPAR